MLSIISATTYTNINDVPFHVLNDIASACDSNTTEYIASSFYYNGANTSFDGITHSVDDGYDDATAMNCLAMLLRGTDVPSDTHHGHFTLARWNDKRVLVKCIVVEFQPKR